MAMPIIRQVSNIRKPDEIKELCSQNTPVFITKNGEVHFVAISPAQYQEYETMKSRAELRAQLSIAEAESRAGAPRISHSELMRQVREKIGGNQL